MLEKNQHIKLSEMARLLSRSTKQFREDVKNYNIPCIKLGRTLLFSPDKVNEYLYKINNKLSLTSTSHVLSKRWQPKPESKNYPLQNEDSTARYKRLVGLE